MVDQSRFGNLWTDAVKNYEEQTGRQLHKDHKFREFRNLEDLQKAILREETGFNSFPSHRRKLYLALAKAMSPFQPVLKIAQDSMGKSPYAPAAAVFGAAALLLHACDSVTKTYEGIEELFEKMHDITVRLREYDIGNDQSFLQVKVNDILAHFLDVIGKVEACVKRKRIKQWVRSVITHDDAISSAVDRLRRYVESEVGLVTALTYGKVKHLHQSTDRTLSDIRTVKDRLDDILTLQYRSKSDNSSDLKEETLSDFLKQGTSYETNAREHATNLEKLTQGTGLWIKDDSVFQAWEEEKAPVLWVYGKPGVGKTMLAARTTEILQNRYPWHSDVSALTSISYLYFRNDNTALQDCAQTLKADALQITKINNRFKKHVLTTIAREEHDSLTSTRQIWRKLFLKFFCEEEPRHGPLTLVFLIMDGLDECPEAERGKVLSCLADLDCSMGKDQSRLRVAIFARPDICGDPGYENVDFKTQEQIIEITPDQNRSDIEDFIRQGLADVRLLKAFKRSRSIEEYRRLAQNVYSSIRSRSQGMFLWAKLVLDQIRESPSPEAIMDSLQRAPESLDNMLYHVLKRLEVQEQMHQSYLRELLTWVAFAYRPLCISELFVLLLVSAGQHCYVIEDHLKARYATLFEVTSSVADSEHEEENDSGRLNEGEDGHDGFDFLDNQDRSDHDENLDDVVGNSAERHNRLSQPEKTTILTWSREDQDVLRMPRR